MYILIGGSPFRSYTGTTTFTGIYVVWTGTTLKEARKQIKERFDDCGGLLLLIDGKTGKRVEG
jgi:hypothetical protein